MSETLRFDLIANDRASSTLKNIGDNADRTSTRMKNFAKVGALAAAGGAVILGKALVDMTQNAMADEAAQRKLAIGLKNATGATKAQVAGVEDWISKQGKVLGITDDELRPAFQRLAEATGSTKEAQKQLSLAMDVSAGTGKSLKTVSEALMKANNGTTASLSKLGLKTKDTEGNTLSLDDAMKKMSQTFGGQAQAAANTTEGKFDRLKVMFDETKESIGAKLIPMADKMATLFMDKVVPAAQRVGDWLRDKLGPPLRDLAEKVGPMATRIMGALKDAFEDAKPFINLMGQVLTNVVVPGLKKLLDVAGPLLVGQIKLLGTVLRGVGEAGTWMWNNALQPAFKFMVNGIGWVMDGWSKMLGAMSNVPGFGWAKKASEDMARAADKAYAMAAGIQKIPTSKTVVITTVYMTRSKAKEDSMGGDFSPRASSRVETMAIKLGELFGKGFEGGVKAKRKTALAAIAELVDRAGDKLATLKDKALEITSGVADAMKGALDVGSLGSVNEDGTRNSVTDQLAGFAQQAGQFASALASAAGKGLNSGLIQKIAQLGPSQGLTAAQALAAMDSAQVASANASLATVDAYAQQLGNTVLTTTSLPADIARQQGVLDTLTAIRADLQAGRAINITVNDATDPDAVVAAIRRYIKRNGKLRDVAAPA